ncbi:MAG: hypothetical protein ACRYGM_00995 [Janthinobacterium lividum]
MPLSLIIQTGTLYASGDSSTFTGTGGPFGFSPYTSQFGGVVSSAGLQNEPFSDTVYSVASGDEVIFVVALQNAQAATAAYDLGLRATIPAGFVPPADGINLSVTDGAGNDLAFTGDLFAGNLRLGQPLPAYNADSGLNVVLLTYTLAAGPALPGPYASLASVATLTHAAASAGGPDLGGGITAATTVVTAAPTPVVQAETSPAAVARGQTVAFDISLAIPAGTLRDVRLDTVLPGGASTLGLVSVAITGVGSGLQLGSRIVGADGGVQFGTITSTGPGPITSTGPGPITSTGQPSVNTISLRVVVQAEGTASGNAVLQTVMSAAGLSGTDARWTATVGSSVGVVVPPSPPGLAGLWSLQPDAPGLGLYPLGGLTLTDSLPAGVATLAVTVQDGSLGRLSTAGAGSLDAAGATFLVQGTLAVLQAAARQLVFTPATAATARLTVTLVDPSGGVAQDSSTTVVTAPTTNVVTLSTGMTAALTEFRGTAVFHGPATLRADRIAPGAAVAGFGPGDTLILPGTLPATLPATLPGTLPGTPSPGTAISYAATGAGIGLLTAGAASVTLLGTYSMALLQAAAGPDGTTAVTFRPDPLFDNAYYLAHNPDVAAAGIDPYQHYLSNGWREGRDPSALFSTSYYLLHNPDVAGAGINPLLHFETSGWAEGRDPSSAFSDSLYLAAYPDVRAAGIDPLLHYMTSGQAEGRHALVKAAVAADPLIDLSYYYGANGDVLAAGIDATAHYLAYGWHEGRDPSAWFDSNYYLTQNPDVRAAAIDPLQHFETSGWREGRQPSLVFDTAKYLAANPDVRAAGLNPLLHYMVSGRYEGRQPALTGGLAPADPLIDAATYNRQLGATLIPTGTAAQQQAAYGYDSTGWLAGLNPDAWFDTKYYLAHNPDVAAARIDPLRHYETSGWREGRDPSAQFSTRKYLAANPDVASAGLDPLLHYVAFGRAEGRAALAV